MLVILLKWKMLRKEYSNCIFKHEDEEAIVTIDFAKVQAVEKEVSEAEVAGA